MPPFVAKVQGIQPPKVYAGETLAPSKQTTRRRRRGAYSLKSRRESKYMAELSGTEETPAQERPRTKKEPPKIGTKDFRGARPGTEGRRGHKREPAVGEMDANRWPSSPLGARASAFDRSDGGSARACLLAPFALECEKTCRGCFVTGCRSGYDSTKCGAEKRHFFKPPVDESRLQLWRRAIPRSDKELTSACAVCDLHFQEEDIVKDFVHKVHGKVVLIPRDKWALQEHAVPRIFPKLPQILVEASEEAEGPDCACTGSP
ncbi:hypothetical protein HPB50_014374 [Hyalomma asiaticum]|uniref:Uncharacterized protein n=1 Tax=Hyalomma asiaticum TaxID=266040 RepID=A0ACB7RQX6_HYAAI|nr:hypothetical protein HPB50_014374 [Hyalomma asiaticum]